MAAIETFFRILPVIYAEQLLITELNIHFKIDHNLFLLESSVNLNRFVNTKAQFECTPQSLHVFENNFGNVTGLDNLNEIRSKNELLIVAPNNFNFESNLNLLKNVKKIQRLRLNIKIGVFLSHIVNADDLRMLFEWSWTNRIINIFAAYINPIGSHLNIFTFNPFGTFKVINVTSHSSDNFFLSQKSNFQQYQLEFGGEEDTKDRTRKLWKTVFGVMNCSYKHLDKSVFSGEIIQNSTIDIYHKSYFKLGLNPDYIYPVEMPTLSILAPEALPYSQFSSYLQHIASNEFFVYSAVTIVMLILLLSFRILTSEF